MNLLTVVIGIVFVLLLFSLLATTIMELIASWFSLRGRNLEKALRNLLASSDIHETLLTDFKENSMYRLLTSSPGRGWSKPSYMSSKTFQTILMDVILKGEGMEKLEERIEQLPDVDLKNILKQLLREADQEVDQFKGKVQEWYDNVMDRASGWYKRYTQKILVGIGLFIAVLFNADTLSIYERLESDPQALSEIVAMAEDFTRRYEGRPLPGRAPQRNEPAVPPPSPGAGLGMDSLRAARSADTLRPRPGGPADTALTIAATDTQRLQALREARELLLTEIEHVKSPLGLGWGNVDVRTYGWYDWLLKILGWVVTALAVTLGAPFWFDLLKRLVNIRNSGNRPGG